MGYESTLIFGVYHKNEDERMRRALGGTYVQIVATIDLCKMNYSGPFTALRKDSPVNQDDLYVYHKSDKAENVDLYDEPFKVLDPHALLRALKREEQNYRRVRLAVPIVEAWIANLDRFGDGIDTPVILHYGH